jgi:hypothetical protein
MGFFMEVQGDFDPDLTIQSERLVEVADYWRMIRGARNMPSRDDVDPLQMPRHLLPHLELIDIERQPKFRLRWRLIGTHVTTAVARDATGKYFDEIYTGEDFATISGPFEWVAANAMPLRWYGTSAFVGKEWLAYEGVYLPLSSDDKTVDRILGAVQYVLR